MSGSRSVVGLRRLRRTFDASRRARFILCGVIAACALLLSTFAASADERAAEKAKRRAIVGATIHPVSSPRLRRATILWKDGKIEALGSEIAIPDDAEKIDGTGKHVCPGFVAVVTSGLGVESAAGDIAHGLDPYDLQLRLALANGITTAQVLASGGGGGFGADPPIPAGSGSAIIKLTQGDLSSMLVREPALNYFSLPSRQLPLNLWLLRDRFERARRWIEASEEAKQKKANPPKLDRDLGPYVTVLQNERPTVFSVRDNQEVRLLLELRQRYGFDLILNEPDDAWKIGGELTRAGVPVWVKSRGRDFDFNLEVPVLGAGDMVAVRRPAAFADRGVAVTILPYRRSISLVGLAGRDLSTLTMDAAFAVRGGLDEERALAAITLEPAKSLGIADRVGSLEPGKDADILLLDHEPLDYRAWVEKAWIHGVLYYDRETSRLYDHVPKSSEKSTKSVDE